MKIIIYSLGLLFILSACEKTQRLEDGQYLIFGIYNGFCQGNCTSLYKIDDTKIFEDQITTFVMGETIDFEDEPMSSEKFDLAKEVFSDLPDKLIDENQRSFGCPGCVDQDIIYLEYYDGDETKKYQVDSDLDAIPEFLRDYADSVKKLVELLKD